MTCSYNRHIASSKEMNNHWNNNVNISGGLDSSCVGQDIKNCILFPTDINKCLMSLCLPLFYRILTLLRISNIWNRVVGQHRIEHTNINGIRLLSLCAKYHFLKPYVPHLKHWHLLIMSSSGNLHTHICPACVHPMWMTLE